MRDRHASAIDAVLPQKADPLTMEPGQGNSTDQAWETGGSLRLAERVVGAICAQILVVSFAVISLTRPENLS
jgi:hypothetical protein